MDWKTANLFGATDISRICGVYEIGSMKVPGTKFKIKVLERGRGDFLAVPNVCLKASDGSEDWIAGLGKTELEALEDALKWFMGALQQREHVVPEDFEWSDPNDF
ncbi:MAG: hypothetical protein M4D80_08600 [Myxococcota bacterium]|nr:hypothetical protein [Myxococcota bacterium]